MRVGEAGVDRALRLMNAIVRALEGAGFGVEVIAGDDGEGSPRRHTTFAVLHGQRVAFSLTETVEKVERPPTAEERAEMRRKPWKRGPLFAYRPTGELSLQIEGDWRGERHRRTRSDGTHARLEGRLHSFLRGLLISADALKRRQITGG